MNRYLASGLLLALALGTACSSKSGDDDDSANTTMSGAGGSKPSGGSGGSSGGTSGTNGGSGTSGGNGSDAMCTNQGDANSTCSPKVPPFSGSCAPAGECCHRSSNIAALDKLDKTDPDADAVIEYRLNYVDITNHPLTIGTPDLVRTAKQRAEVCAGEQCLLWRFTQPRKGGEFIKGPGKVEIGIGAYNCDGTYSFYGPNAAPDRTKEIGESDPGRWQSVEVPADVDPSRDDVERFHIPWATNLNRKVARSIFLWPMDFTLDWELASSGFTITDFKWDQEALDCVGKRDGFNWSTVNGFVSYSPIKGNDKDISNQTAETYCALLAFGILPDNMKDTACTIDRCMPGSDGCMWKKLPDALCPEDDTERGIFGCHLGDEANLNAEMGYPDKINCTAEKPTTPLDTDNGATSEGQCCDPLAKSTTLPACNAYRTIGVFVAAAAEITDKPLDGMAKSCFAK